MTGGLSLCGICELSRSHWAHWSPVLSPPLAKCRWPVANLFLPCGRLQARRRAYARASYFAYSITLVSRRTLTLIWPGYSSSSSIFLAMSRARRVI